MREAVGGVASERRAPGWDAGLPAVARPAFTPWVPLALVGSDVMALITACTAAVALRTGLRPVEAVPRFLSVGGLVMLALWLVVLWQRGLYRRRIDLSVVHVWPSLVVSLSLAMMLVLVLAVTIGPGWVLPEPMGVEDAVLAALILVATTLAGRVLVRSAQKLARTQGVSEKRTLIIGAGAVGTLLAEKMLRSPELGLVPVAFWDAAAPESHRRDRLGLPVYRRDSDLERTIAAERINHVIVAFSSVSFHDIVGEIEKCCAYPVEITVVPRLFEITAMNPRMDEIEGIPIAVIHRRGLSRAGAFVKRAFDLTLAATIVVMLSPVLAAAALAVRFETGTPVLFRQSRIGKDLRPFTMFKFRSMVTTAEQDRAGLDDCNELEGPVFKMRDDPRVTGVGRWLRRYSIDELPQLFNVLRGDMSLVGPRPPLPGEVDEYTEWQAKRMSITPGMTGLWQILGRTELSFDEMVSLDLNYAWNWSLWLDLSILARTLGAVVGGKGAC